MDVRDFFIKVKFMREAQREYFATRSKESLVRAKQYEKAVDEDLVTIGELFK